jgi:hypothetical protein
MTLKDHSECTIPRDEVESILDDEIEETGKILLFTRSSDDPPSYSSHEHDSKRKCYRCEKFEVSLSTKWNEAGLLTSDMFMFDEKSEEYVEKARM